MILFILHCVTMQLRLVLNLRSSCLNLLSVEIAGGATTTSFSSLFRSFGRPPPVLPPGVATVGPLKDFFKMMGVFLPAVILAMGKTG
jgi:hypothetical protein